MQDYFHIAELWRAGYRPFFCETGNDPLIVMVAAGITHIWDKQQYLKEVLGARSVWLSRQLQGYRNLREEGIQAIDFYNLCRGLNLRKKLDNIVALMVHAAVSHTAPERLKRTVPGIRCASYIYDFLNLFVPKDQMEVWKEYHGGTTQRAETEYAYLEKILSGELSDIVLYKDYGPDWDFMKRVPVPTFWFPQTLPKRLYQAPPNPNDKLIDFIYIGTIVPKFSHGKPSGLFDDIMMETIFREVTDQGFRIHAFVLDPHPDVMAEYQRLFPEGTVRVFPGTLLDLLLPRIAGRYRWGWMFYHFPQPIILPMVRITLPTKLYTYLAMGLPMVVSSEFESVARLIRQWKCGVVVEQAEIPYLPDILKQYNYEQLVQNVLRLREHMHLEAHLPTLAKAMRTAIKREPIWLPPYDDHETQQIQNPDREAAYERPTTLDGCGSKDLLFKRPASGPEDGPDPASAIFAAENQAG